MGAQRGRAVWAPSVAALCGRPVWPRGVGAQRGRAVGAQRGRAVSAQRGGVGGRAVWAPSVAARCGRPGWPRGVGAQGGCAVWALSRGVYGRSIHKLSNISLLRQYRVKLLYRLLQSHA